jgi:hypothetical protein
MTKFCFDESELSTGSAIFLSLIQNGRLMLMARNLQLALVPIHHKLA